MTDNTSSLKAGFAELDITPPVGTHKMGWIIDIVSDRVLDPLYARAAVFEDGRRAIAFLQVDTLSIRWTQVNDIRRRIASAHGFPGKHIMVCATHNHAGPAVSGWGKIRSREEAYIETLTLRCVEVFGRALKNRRAAALGFGSVFDFDIAHNRRVIMRDGTVKTHGSFADPDALCLEGPIDPEVAVLAARARNGRILGCLVNYACHPTHHGGETTLSAGFPGVLAQEMKRRGCPYTLFLQGACGNTHTTDPVTRKGMTKEQAGCRLAQDARGVLEQMTFNADWRFGAASRTLQLQQRKLTKDEIRGTAHGAQRFVDPSRYDAAMPYLVRRLKARKTQPAEVQVLFAGNLAFAGIPAEYFVEHGLRIKEQSHPRRALVVGEANGMVGYVPTQQAFKRGGYETTFGPGSRMAPEAGDLLADTAIGLIRKGHK